MTPRVLIVAGSDSGGGAGIQADIKTVTALGGFAMTAVTAITVQDSLKVHDVLALSPTLVADQMRVVLADLGADAIKTGMLPNAAIITAIADVLKHKRTPIVVDPVMVASSGDPLIDHDAIDALKTRLFPLAMLITPNLDEGALLLGRQITAQDQLADAAQELLDLGSRAVLLKGAHLPGEEIVDTLATAQGVTQWRALRIDSRASHGTGCTLASAIADGIGRDLGLEDAVVRARQFVRNAIAAAPGFGAGHGPLGHGQIAKS